jgi:hypothetical protein
MIHNIMKHNKGMRFGAKGANNLFSAVGSHTNL